MTSTREALGSVVILLIHSLPPSAGSVHLFTLLSLFSFLRPSVCPFFSPSFTHSISPSSVFTTFKSFILVRQSHFPSLHHSFTLTVLIPHLPKSSVRSLLPPTLTTVPLPFSQTRSLPDINPLPSPSLTLLPSLPHPSPTLHTPA